MELFNKTNVGFVSNQVILEFYYYYMVIVLKVLKLKYFAEVKYN